MIKTLITGASGFIGRHALAPLIQAGHEVHAVSFKKKSEMDTQNPKVKEWETLMWTFQQALPNSEDGAKWVLMDKIYDLKTQVV